MLPQQGYRRFTAYNRMLMIEVLICVIAGIVAIASPSGMTAAATVLASIAGAVGVAFAAYAGGDAYAKSKNSSATDVKEQ